MQWADDEEPTLLWSWDNFHSPLPSSPMGLAVSEITRAGVEAANRAFGRENRGRRKIINGYVYSSAASTSDEERANSARLLDAEIPRLRRRWDEELLPELRRNLNEMKAADLASLDDAGLLEMLDRFLAIATRHWEIHFRVVFPVGRAMDRFRETCSELLGEEKAAEWQTLIDSSQTKTVEVNEALVELAKSAARMPEVRRILKQDDAAGNALRNLDGSAEGRGWLARLHGFLDAYGYRPTGYDIRFPTWRDDPTFVLVSVKTLIEHGEVVDRSRDSESDRTIRRAAWLESLHEKIGSDPEKRNAIEEARRTAQDLWPLKEDHAFYIDQATVALVRDAILQLGRTLVAKEAIEHPEDVFYLHLDEARELTRLPEDVRRTVHKRHMAIESYSRLNPPKYLGTLPAQGVPEDAEEALAAMEVDRPSTLRGQGASGGSALGPARVIRSPEEFHKVRAGDILICRSTSPTWTPLFNVVAALVSESGGVLSHPAVVAREYGLPAVVAVHRCTELLEDGDLLRVDGTEGQVNLA